MAIIGNEALFSLIGTEFGGDGRTTFALPNLPVIKSRVAGPKKKADAKKKQRASYSGDVAYFINLQGVYPTRN